MEAGQVYRQQLSSSLWSPLPRSYSEAVPHPDHRELPFVLFWGQTRGFLTLLWQPGQGGSLNAPCLPPWEMETWALGSALSWDPVFLVLCPGRQEQVGGSWGGVGWRQG